jgi:hypothetical protein
VIDSQASELGDGLNDVDSPAVSPADGQADALGHADARADGGDGAGGATGTGGRTGRGGASGAGGVRATGGNGGGITSTGGKGIDGAIATGGTTTGGAIGSGGTIVGSGGVGPGGSGGAISGDAAFGCTANVSPDAGDRLGEGLVAYYQCEPATLTALPDSSGNSADGTLVTGTGGNAGFSYGPGRIGQAVDFSVANQGYATLPSNLLAGAQETTVATWVYVNNAIDWQRIFDFGKAESDGTAKVYMYLATSEDAHGYLHFAISTTGPGSSEQSMDGPVLSTKTWHHVAVVLGASGGILYVDGCRAGANAKMTLRPADLPHPLAYYIGLSQWTRYPVHLDADIDEFRVYSRALAPEEIQALAGGA